MIDIQPRCLSLIDLLNRRLFKIPDYQRAYSWTKRECKDLFNDIKNTYLKKEQKGEEENHFMATIVCLHREKTKLGTTEYDVLDVVDGQQRLTTIALILNAIKLAFDSTKQEQDFKEISELLVKKQGDNLFLLQTNHDTSHHFSDFLRDGKVDPPDQGKTLADRKLLDAISYCQSFVDDWTKKDKRPLIDLYDCLKNRLFFILHQISDEKIVYTVFEVLNSRGMEVSWLDRLKSILMGKAFELINENPKQLIDDLKIIWRNIYRQIRLNQGLNTEALRFAATLYKSKMPGRRLSEEDAVDEFRSKALDAKSIREIAKWLLEVTKACDKVISNPHQNAVTRISQARLLAVAIHLNEKLGDFDRKKLLSQWEKVSFRIYGMMRCDARQEVGHYVQLAWKIVNEELSVKEIHSHIRTIGAKFPISEAVQALRNRNCYDGWEDELRYFMFRYEENLTCKNENNFRNEQWERIWKESPSRSIEHIIPQSVAPDHVKHMLGNLMILPPTLNAKLQDKPPEQKLERYHQTGLLSAIEVASKSPWTEKTVQEREEELLLWAEKEWADLI